MIKMIALLKRKPDLSHEEFVDHWINIHAPLARGIPGTRRYVQCHIVTEQRRADIEEIPLEADGIAELWFDSAESMKDTHQTAKMQRLLADGATFIGQIKTFIVDETDIDLIPQAARASARDD